MNTKETIKHDCKYFTREELEIQYLTLKGKLRIRDACAKWLDALADDLRDGSDYTYSDYMYEDYKELQKDTKELYKNEYGIEL